MFYNSHIHIFRDVDVPEQFIPFGLVKIWKTAVGYKMIAKTLRNMLPFTDKDALDRFARFITTGAMGSQKKIFERCLESYPADTKFIVLSMDMEFMGAGKVSRTYNCQIEELARLKKEYPNNVIPFYHVDPRRPCVVEFLKYAVEAYGFMGVKLYPPLGYFPYDTRLDEVYKYCQEKNLPIMAHCSPYSSVQYKGKMKDLKQLLIEGNPRTDVTGKNRKELCSLFTNPLNYKQVIKKFPKLRICFAHFGSDSSWERYMDEGDEDSNWFTMIKKLISEYPNFYSDISYVLNDKKFWPVLQGVLCDDKMKEKVLFGSDYYMVEVQADEKVFGKSLRNYIGEDYFQQIAVKNPEKFLDNR